MTPRQKKCLDFIGDFWANEGYAPSYEEIAKGLKAKSKSSVSSLVKTLEQRGYLERIPHHARSIKLTEQKGSPAPQSVR
jgi:repressor LexA